MNEKLVISKQITIENINGIKGVKVVKEMTEAEMDAMAENTANQVGKLVERCNWTDHTGTEKEYHVKDIPEAPPEVTKEPEVASDVLAENLAAESVESAFGSESVVGESCEGDAIAEVPVKEDLGAQEPEQKAPVNGKKKR